MKIYSRKKIDNFFLPVTNNSCRDDLNYRVRINDVYGILSIENNETLYSPGESRYITVPKIPGFFIENDKLVAIRSYSTGSPVYFLEIHIPSFAEYQHFDSGNKFYLFSEEGLFTGIELEYVTTVGGFPRFSVDQFSLARLLGGNLPDVNSPVVANGSYTIALQPETRVYLRISSRTYDYTEKYASVKLEIPGKRSLFYEFYVTPEEEKIQPNLNPPSVNDQDDTLQLARSFVPISSSMTLQLDSGGKLYMDKIWASSSPFHMSYRRRCTNLGLARDSSKFFEYVPADSIYSFNEIDLKYSTDKFSEQYFTGINAGVERTIGNRESLKAFAPLWIKGKVPQYFAIFAKPVTSETSDLFSESRVVKIIDIKNSELGPYLDNIKSNDKFNVSPVHIDTQSNYKVTWTGLSVKNGEWTEHIEFLGSDIQSGLSDFEFNDLITSGFSRGGIYSPQFMNIEFLFDDKDASPFEIYQYFGLYCDSIEIGKYSVDLQKTSSLFTQDFSSSPDKFLTDSLVISSKDDVKVVLSAKRFNEARMVSRSSDEASKNSNIYKLRHYATTESESSASKKLIVTIYSMFDPEELKSGSFTVRLEKEDGTLVQYLNVTGCAYESLTGIATLTCTDDDVYSTDGNKYYVRFFDFDPDETTTSNGSFRLDASDASKSSCIVLSKQDLDDNELSRWLDGVADQKLDVRQAIVLYDTTRLSNVTFLPKYITSTDDYYTVFFELLENNGNLSNGGVVTLDLLSDGKSVSFPPSTSISSPGRQYVLQTKNSFYSISTIDVIDAGNEMNAIASIKSNVLDFGNTKANIGSTAIPAKKVEDFKPLCSIKFVTQPDFTPTPGDSIIIERKTKTSVKRWNVMLDNRQTVDHSSMGGWKKTIQFTGFNSNKDWTTLEVSSDELYPEGHFIYTLVSEDPSNNVTLEYVSTENVGNNKYRLYFSGGKYDVSLYGYLQVENVEHEIVYSPIVNSQTLESMFLIGLQSFKNPPFKCSIESGNLCVIMDDDTGDSSIMISNYFNRSIKINGRMARKQFINYDRKITYAFSRFVFRSSDNVYSIPESFSGLIKESTSVFSPSGKNCRIISLDERNLFIPDVLGAKQARENSILISLDSEPFIKDGRIKLVEELETSIHLLSFKRFVDLNFFDELPYRDSQGISFSRVGLSQDYPFNNLNGEEYTKEVLVRNRSSITKEQSTNNIASSMRSQRGKTFPNVGRWKKSDSSNANLEPYTLNADPLQLQYDNFTGIPYNDAIPDTFPLDFYVISGWPMDATPEDEFTYDYTGKRIDPELLKSVDYDYFTAYFSVGDGSEKFTSGNRRSYRTLWSKVKTSDDDKFETMFKGLPLRLISKNNIDGYRFCSVLQVEDGNFGPRKITVITNEKWRCITLLVSVSLSTSSIDGSLTVKELYNLSNNQLNTQYGQLYGPMCIFGSDDILRFDLSPRAYNDKKIIKKNSYINPTNSYDDAQRHDGFRREEYETKVTIEYDYAAPNDIELLKVPYYPNCDYIIEGLLYKENVKISMCIPRERIRGVYDPVLMRKRTFVDGSYLDSFFSMVCDSTTGPIKTLFKFDGKDSITCDGSLRLYGQNSAPVDVSGILTKISSPVVYAVGDQPVYADTINSCVAQKVLEDISYGLFHDIYVGLSGKLSQSKIQFEYNTPQKLKPNSYKSAFVDFSGKITFTDSKNDLNIFRVDGDFEPSYKDVLHFSSSEDKLLSKIFYNSFNGMNTNVVGTNNIGLWFRRVSDNVISDGITAVNGDRVRLPFAVGRIFIQPNIDIWKNAMYAKAKDKTIDVGVIGIDAKSTGRFFLGSRECNLPRYLRSHQYDHSVNDENFSVSYVTTSNYLTLQVNLKKIIADEIFSKGLAKFFDNVRSVLSSSNPYAVAREYIESELINAYSIKSVEIYTCPSSVTEVISSVNDPKDLKDYRKMDELQVNDQNGFVTSFPLDGAYRVLLAFNITRN
jgi:hypothetical protein